MRNWKISTAALALWVCCAPAFAQSTAALSQEIEELREDLRVLQRQMYRGQVSNDPGEYSGTVQQRLSQLEETVRKVSGRMDEIDYKFKQIDERFNVLNKDIDVRFKMLEGKPISGGLGVENKAQKFDAPVASNPAKFVAGEQVQGEELAPLDMPKKAEPAPKPKAAAPQDVNSIYKRALDAYYAKKYAEAELGFNQILSKYPKDKLASNAQYWLGEISYNLGDYKKAAVAFGKGYKNYKSGNKGADSLYKLGVSMQQLGKNAEACAAYKSLPTEFPKADKELLAKSKKALTTLKCK